MLDQSFSLDNFKTILEIENRKGSFEMDFFSNEFQLAADKLIRIRAKIKDFRQQPIYNEEEFKRLMDEKRKIENEKNDYLEKDLLKFSNDINKSNFKFSINTFIDKKSGKAVFTIGEDAASYFAMKQLQHNIFRTFKVKQSNRYQIVKQVKSLLKDNFPKYVVRTDIEGFYENVPQEKLLQIINTNPLLSPRSKYLIKIIFDNYNELTGNDQEVSSKRRGIPRGIGISAYLAELYMRTIDNEIQDLPDVSFYGRYVDDIIVFFTPKIKENSPNFYLNEIKKIVKREELDLKIDSDPQLNKTEQYDLFTSNKKHSITFLGYRFELEDREYKSIYLSDNKMNKYKTRIEKTIEAFIFESKFNYKMAKKLLIHRLNYLTKNTRLVRPKKGLIGIYYSNSLIENDCPCLDELNLFLYDIIDRKILPNDFPKLKERISSKKFDFKKGFDKKLFFNIQPKGKNDQLSNHHKNIPDLRRQSLKDNIQLHNNFEKIIAPWKS